MTEEDYRSRYIQKLIYSNNRGVMVYNDPELVYRVKDVQNDWKILKMDCGPEQTIYESEMDPVSRWHDELLLMPRYLDEWQVELN